VRRKYHQVFDIQGHTNFLADSVVVMRGREAAENSTVLKANLVKMMCTPKMLTYQGGLIIGVIIMYQIIGPQK
jgi:hypothetical protein